MPDVSSHKALKFDCLFFVEYFAMDLIMSFTALAETWVPWCPMSCFCGPWYSEVSCYSLLWKMDLSWRIYMDLPLFTYYSKHCNFPQLCSTTTRGYSSTLPLPVVAIWSMGRMGRLQHGEPCMVIPHAFSSRDSRCQWDVCLLYWKNLRTLHGNFMQ